MTGLAAIAAELGAAASRIDERRIESLCRSIAAARRVVVFGCGREALQIRGFAMRLHHLGLDVAVVGDMTTPPVGEGDIFLVTSGPGELSTVMALIGQARSAGARVAVLTAVAEGSAAKAADEVLVVPAQTMADDRGEAPSILPMGSVYEGVLFVLFEAMVLRLKEMLGVSAEAMRERHTNLE
jgi:6-phospho-3-hexuloisomerase